VNVFIGNKISKELIDVAEKLELIQVPGAGVDNLDLKLLYNKNIQVCNSHSNAPYVAEHAVALLFSLLKKISIHDRLMRDGLWFRPKHDKRDDHYLSDSIIGKTVGFLGFGNVAQNIARFLSGFEVSFIAYEKKPNRHKNAVKIDYFSLNEVMARSDILFITLPLTDETKDSVSIENLKLMKDSAYLVNISRGPVVNQEALYESLKGNYIRSAAIDVWYDDICIEGDKKYPSKRYPFHKLQNIVLSPYRASYIREMSPHLSDVVDNLVLFATKNKLKNIVDIYEEY
jgi:lactate dehydrogenase-like 2-hydroxyacid dehydrogenase